jgi:hypothetical protein
MKWHPHIHLVVTGAGLSLDGKRWIETDPGFLMHHGGLKTNGTHKIFCYALEDQMKKLEYLIEINADKIHVWKTMLEPGKYEQWVKAFSEGSRFEGRWEQAATVRFVDPNIGGTRAILEIFDPHDCILAKHIAMITADGREETDSEAAKQWIGTSEKYVFIEHEGKTTLTIEMNTHPSFVEMFDACWPEALENIKLLSAEQDI